MVGKQDGNNNKRNERNPPPRKTTIIRIFRTLKRQYHHARRYGKKGETEHQINERIMARWTRRVGIFTIVLAIVASITAGIFWRQLDVMQGQLNVLEADQRPWMKVQEITPYIHPIDSRIGGLRFNGENTVGFLPLHFLLKNVGRSPAFDVRVGIGHFLGYAQKINDLAKEQQQRCASLDNVFPYLPWSWTVQLLLGSFSQVTKCHT